MGKRRERLSVASMLHAKRLALHVGQILGATRFERGPSPLYLGASFEGGSWDVAICRQEGRGRIARVLSYLAP
jgi:hypothetical protein